MSSGHPSIVVVYPPGAARDALVEALAGRDPSVIEDPAEVALGPRAHLLLAAPGYLRILREALGTGAVLVALLGPSDSGDIALSDGADDVLPWPGSTPLLHKRVQLYVDGYIGPGRMVLDPRRATSLVHAIRNPLNVITLYAELLKMEPLGEEAQGSVGRLMRAARRVDALVGELETLLYLESGQAPIRRQPIELGELVQMVVAELEYDIEDKPLKVELELAGSGTLALADPDLGRRSVHAVFGRVTKLCVGQSVVEVRIQGHPPRIEIEAPIDPVPPEQVGAFRAGPTELDARESMGGVGVGLAFAHRAMEAMSGRLEHGTTDEGRAVTLLIFEAA